MGQIRILIVFIDLKYKTIDTPKIESILKNTKKKCFQFVFFKMLSIFGVSIVLYFIKILSGSHNL
jgi:hypothetical protein